MVTHSDNMLEKQLIYPALDTSSTSRNKKKTIKPEDPMSHRIIEKRRRDRMNNCLADLSRLIPTDYLKKGRGRIEKTEIIEMAIKHMRHLQNIIASTRNNEVEKNNNAGRQPIVMEHYRLGYLECLSEAMHFLVEIQGFFAGDALCVQMINHLHRHCDSILLGKLSQEASHSEAVPMGGNMGYPRGTSSSNASSNSIGTGSSPPLGMSNSTGNASSPPLGMSNSTNGNSDDHPDYTYSSENEESFVRRSFSSSSGIASIAIKEESEGPSQLRDMLTNSGRKSESSGHDSNASIEEHHMYKFKNTIQQRYNESQNQDDDEPPSKKMKNEEPSQVNGRLSFGHKALANQQPTSQSQLSDVKPTSVPVFALHENGSYYIPLTLDQHALSPHLPILTSKPMHKSVLHPVTISVNFQKQNQS